MSKVAPAPLESKATIDFDATDKVIEEKPQEKAEEKPGEKLAVEPEAKPAAAPVPSPAAVQAEAKTQNITSSDIVEAQKIVSNMDPGALASLINAASAASVATKELGGKKTRRRRKNKSKSAKRRR
jgi:hypothetical protein